MTDPFHTIFGVPHKPKVTRTHADRIAYRRMSDESLVYKRDHSTVPAVARRAAAELKRRYPNHGGDPVAFWAEGHPDIAARIAAAIAAQH